MKTIQKLCLKEFSFREILSLLLFVIFRKSMDLMLKTASPSLLHSLALSRRWQKCSILGVVFDLHGHRVSTSDFAHRGHCDSAEIWNRLFLGSAEISQHNSTNSLVLSSARSISVAFFSSLSLLPSLPPSLYLPSSLSPYLPLPL